MFFLIQFSSTPLALLYFSGGPTKKRQEVSRSDKKRHEASRSVKKRQEPFSLFSSQFLLFICILYSLISYFSAFANNFDKNIGCITIYLTL